MNTFTLTVELGNDAMQTGADVAHLLRKLAKKIEDEAFTVTDYGTLQDVNGNTVARWEVR